MPSLRFPSAGSGATFPFRLRVPERSGRPDRGSGATAAAVGSAMAELVQGQNAPVGMKAEGFVDALHRVRQVRAREAPAGGGRPPRRRLGWAPGTREARAVPSGAPGPEETLVESSWRLLARLHPQVCQPGFKSQQLLVGTRL